MQKRFYVNKKEKENSDDSFPISGKCYVVVEKTNSLNSTKIITLSALSSMKFSCAHRFSHIPFVSPLLFN